jgi:ATP-dependent protease HslVU (ClpYQ) ATPase subunit
MVLCIVYLIAYIILRVLAYKEQNTKSYGSIEKQKSESKPRIKSKYRNVEIVSKDLYMEAENLIATHDVYAFQVENISKQIDDIERTLNKYKMSKKDKLTIKQAVGDGSDVISDKEAEVLVSKSLKLQETRCRIEAKILRIMKQLDKIAEEELRRQTSK